MQFLFDILNDMAGYTELYYDEQNLTEAEWKKKVFPMRDNHNDPYLRDDYPHVLLTIDNAENFLRMNDSRAVNWLHAVIVRLHNGERFRRHFPVFMVNSDSIYFSFEIYDKLGLQNIEIPNLEFKGYKEVPVINGLSSIYNVDQVKLIQKYIGRNPYHLHIFTRFMMSSNGKLRQNLKYASKDMPEFAHIKTEFLHKINTLYSCKRLAPYLDSGEIDFMILHILKRFVEAPGKPQFLHSP